MTERSAQEEKAERLWRAYLTTGEFEKERRQRRFLRLLPGTLRCKNCYAPFQGIGSPVVKLIYGKRPSNMNPHICNACEDFAREYLGGADVELSLLFVDVRGSTTIAERMSPMEFSQLINRFYSTATNVMARSDALIDKIIGDQAAGMYVPGFAGKDHARHAIIAAQQILLATGHESPNGPWIPLGAGVHTGIAFVGSVGSQQGAVDITVLGDVANTAARLSSSAGIGEILISETACASAGMQNNSLEQRVLDLKGKTESITTCVLRDYSPAITWTE
jgi:adenylate cyclase